MGRTKQKRLERAKHSAASRRGALPQPRPAGADEVFKHMLGLELDRHLDYVPDGTTVYALAFDPAEGSATVFFHSKELCDDEDGEEPYWVSSLMIYPDAIDATETDMEVGGIEEWRFHPDHLQCMRDIEAMVNTWDECGPFSEEDLAQRDAEVRAIYDRYASRYPGRVSEPWQE
jgi:hypothetical protein